MWYKFDGRWENESTLKKMFDGFCWGRYERVYPSIKESFDFFIAYMKAIGVVVDEQPNPSVIDFLKCGQRLHAIKCYQSIFPKKSLPECRDDVGIISSDLFRFSNGKYGESQNG